MAGSLGLALSFGAAGANEGLERLLARQELQRQVLAEEDERRLRHAMLQEDRSFRRQEASERAEDRKRDNERLDRAEAAATAERASRVKDREDEEKREADRVARLTSLANDPQVDPDLRRQAQHLLLTGGKSVPFEVRDRDQESRLAHERRKELLVFADAIRGRSEERKEDAKSKDDPQAPNGVKEYLLKLRSKYQNPEEAVAELDRAWSDITKVHPRADATLLTNELLRLFNTPRGVKPTRSITIDEAAMKNR